MQTAFSLVVCYYMHSRVHAAAPHCTSTFRLSSEWSKGMNMNLQYPPPIFHIVQPQTKCDCDNSQKQLQMHFTTCEKVHLRLNGFFASKLAFCAKNLRRSLTAANSELYILQLKKELKNQQQIDNRGMLFNIAHT